MPDSPNVVLDSFALIAFLRDESGADFIDRMLHDAASGRCHLWMTEVNYAEVHYIIQRKEGAAVWQTCEKAIASLPIRFVPGDRTLANAAATFKANHKLSLADAFAAALAQDLPATLITTDPEFKALIESISIVLSKNSRALLEQTAKRLNSEFADFVEDGELDFYDIMHAPTSFTAYELDSKLIFVAKKQA